jgi:hypothetical protein
VFHQGSVDLVPVSVTIGVPYEVLRYEKRPVVVEDELNEPECLLKDISVGGQ